MRNLLLPGLLLCCVTGAFSQSIVKTIDITPGENSVSSSLPFDRPIILRWTAKDPVIIAYAGLLVITKGNTSEYYKNFAQSSVFYNQHGGRFAGPHNVVTMEETELITDNPPANADGKYVTNIFLPPLEPNRFYDIKIVRRPVDSELGMYVDLFRALKDGDNELFKRRLALINKFKKPFEHDYLAGPQSGKSRDDDLKDFYNTYLAAYYPDVIGADKDKAAVAVQKVKTMIQTDQPPSMTAQALAYLKLFDAIRVGNDANTASAIDNLDLLLKGHIASVADHHHVGYDDDVALAAYYNDPNNKPHIDSLLVRLRDAADDPARLKVAEDFVNTLSISGLPRADYMFLFGQTLSSSTAALDFDTRTGYTITPDFGYVYYGFQPGFNNMTPYVGFQLEFRYFDKNIPFNLIHPKSPWHYLSFTTGLTLTSLKKDGKRDDLFSGKSLLLGLGFRLSSATRITFGGIVFNKEDPNPLLDRKKMTVTPFAGISIDLKLKSILNDFYSISPTKKP